MSGAPVRGSPLGPAPLPLLGVALGLLAAAGYLHGTGSTVGSPHFPLWLLFLGMGVIVLGGGVAVVLFSGAGESADAEPLTTAPEPAPGTGSDHPPAAVVSNLPAIPEPPEPPRPLASWSGELTRRADSAGPAATRAVPAPVPVSATSAPAGPAPAAPLGEGALACASCGTPLPARAAWRRCRTCGKSLCVVCLTESVRHYGSGYCRTCAPAPG